MFAIHFVRYVLMISQNISWLLCGNQIIEQLYNSIDRPNRLFLFSRSPPNTCSVLHLKCTSNPAVAPAGTTCAGGPVPTSSACPSSPTSSTSTACVRLLVTARLRTLDEPTVTCPKSSVRKWSSTWRDSLRAGRERKRREGWVTCGVWWLTGGGGGLKRER